jgi:hypothetical protein
MITSTRMKSQMQQCIILYRVYGVLVVLIGVQDEVPDDEQYGGASVRSCLSWRRATRAGGTVDEVLPGVKG